MTNDDEKTLVVLRAALEIVKEGWSHCATARDANGAELERWDLPEAVSFCAGAAISKAATEIYGEPPLGYGPIGSRSCAIFATLDLIEAGKLVLGGSDDEVIGSVTEINDAAGSSAATVQERMRDAIRLVEGRSR